uniref:Uncharacterized protein n=1 Tax=Anguilla anguilla TaxID=7936 RepID=A0A0E9R5M6_ANGAN
MVHFKLLSLDTNMISILVLEAMPRVCVLIKALYTDKIKIYRKRCRHPVLHSVKAVFLYAVRSVYQLWCQNQLPGRATHN